MSASLAPTARVVSAEPAEFAAAAYPEPAPSAFGAFERSYYEGGPRPADTVDAAALEHLTGRLREAEYAYLSLDVFDTLLLRNSKCESRRFWEIAERWKALLPRSFRAISRDDLYAARLRAAEIAYSCGPILNSTQEGRLDSLVGVTLALTKLPSDLQAQFISAELAYEGENTLSNPLILSLVSAHRQAGGRIVLLSDMYMSASEIYRLLCAHGIGDVPDRLFTSAETTVNKRTGTIFGPVARALGVDAAAIFHVGDSFQSDFFMPRFHGWAAQHLPIPLHEERLRDGDLRAFRDTVTGFER
jgi:predicted HAD superfamily hydrolase